MEAAAEDGRKRCNRELANAQLRAEAEDGTPPAAARASSASPTRSSAPRAAALSRLHVTVRRRRSSVPRPPSSAAASVSPSDAAAALRRGRRPRLPLTVRERGGKGEREEECMTGGSHNLYIYIFNANQTATRTTADWVEGGN